MKNLPHPEERASRRTHDASAANVPAPPLFHKLLSPPVLRQSRGGEIPLLELALLFETLLIGSRLGARVGAILARPLEFLPGSDAVRLKLLHEIPQRRPNHLMGEARIPSDRDAEGEMLVEAELARQAALHERKRALDDRPSAPDLVLRMRRFELHPVDPRLALVGAQPPQAIDQPAARGVAGIALGHHDKVGIELVLHVDG